MAEKKRTFVRDLKMADRRKQIERLYDGNDESLRRIFDKAMGQKIGYRYNEDYYNKLLMGVGTEAMDKEQIMELAQYAYSTDPNFAKIIDYLSNMFLWRYYYVPVKMKKRAEESEYGFVYNLMSEIVDGLAIEITFPMVLTKLFKEGAVYLYAKKNHSSKTVSTIMLNNEYCRPVLTSQYGTGVFQFDLSYFDDLVLYGEELETVLDMFPEEIVAAYRAYKENKTRNEFIILDGRYSTYISANDFNFPTMLSTLKGVFDFDQYRKNEVERSAAQLDTIITHKIPSYENRLLFELSEVRALHKSMSKILGQNKRTRLMTTFGDVSIHPMQEQSKVANDNLKQGHEAIFRSSGLNSNLFDGQSAESLEQSLKRDESIVWKYAQQLINFYNLAINNLYSFRGYQLEINLLPITHYNLKDMMELYRRNAEYGVGRIEAVVASGTKQKHISHKHELEEFLKLDEILKPLQSSHTTAMEKNNLEIEKEEIEEKTQDLKFKQEEWDFSDQ